jgi:hypothetical protein
VCVCACVCVHIHTIRRVDARERVCVFRRTAHTQAYTLAAIYTHTRTHTHTHNLSLSFSLSLSLSLSHLPNSHLFLNPKQGTRTWPYLHMIPTTITRLSFPSILCIGGGISIDGISINGISIDGISHTWLRRRWPAGSVFIGWNRSLSLSQGKRRRETPRYGHSFLIQLSLSLSLLTHSRTRRERETLSSLSQIDFFVLFPHVNPRAVTNCLRTIEGFAWRRSVCVCVCVYREREERDREFYQVLTRASEEREREFY